MTERWRATINTWLKMKSNNKHVSCLLLLFIFSHVFIVILHLSVTCLLLLFISQSHVYCCSSSFSHMFIVALHLSVTCLLLKSNNKHMTERWRTTINTWLKMKSNNKHIHHSDMCLLLFFISQSHVYCCSSSLSHVFIVALHLSVTCLLLFFISQSHVYCCSSSLSHMFIVALYLQSHDLLLTTVCCVNICVVSTTCDWEMKSNNKYVTEWWRTTINTWLKMKSNDKHVTERWRATINMWFLHLSITCLLLFFISQSHV
jgi:hypothetical protein